MKANYLSYEVQNVRILRQNLGRVDVKLYYLGMLCVPSFSSLSIEECHNILPCYNTPQKLGA